jgi:hypothetical protein
MNPRRDAWADRQTGSGPAVAAFYRRCGIRNNDRLRGDSFPMLKSV